MTGKLQEVEFEIAGKKYSCRPTFKTLVTIENALGQPCRTLGIKCFTFAVPLDRRGPNAQEISLSELSSIIFQMVKDTEGAPESVAEVGDALMEDGYSHLIGPVGEFLTRAQQGNAEHARQMEKKTKKNSGKPPDAAAAADRTATA